MPLTALSPAQERLFRLWYWLQALRSGISPNPDDPAHKYDYRAAYLAGTAPAYGAGDGRMHWPSQFKAGDHPNRYVNGIDTRGPAPANELNDLMRYLQRP